MKTYVVGFMFDIDYSHVLLIQKNRPDWMKGMLNGPGGKIEIGETPGQAMVREFREETGIAQSDWRLFCRLDGFNEEIKEHYMIFFFMIIGDIYESVEGMTDEEVQIIRVDDIHRKHVHGYNLNLVPNLRWLIPMALDEYSVKATVRNTL